MAKTEKKFKKGQAVEVFQAQFAYTSAGSGKFTVLATTGLGSCIGVALYNSENQSGCLVHADNFRASMFDKSSPNYHGNVGHHFDAFISGAKLVQVHLVGGDQEDYQSINVASLFRDYFSRHPNVEILTDTACSKQVPKEGNKLALDVVTGEVIIDFDQSSLTRLTNLREHQKMLLEMRDIAIEEAKKGKDLGLCQLKHSKLHDPESLLRNYAETSEEDSASVSESYCKGYQGEEISRILPSEYDIDKENSIAVLRHQAALIRTGKVKFVGGFIADGSIFVAMHNPKTKEFMVIGYHEIMGLDSLRPFLDYFAANAHGLIINIRGNHKSVDTILSIVDFRQQFYPQFTQVQAMKTASNLIAVNTETFKIFGSFSIDQLYFNASPEDHYIKLAISIATSIKKPGFEILQDSKVEDLAAELKAFQEGKMAHTPKDTSQDPYDQILEDAWQEMLREGITPHNVQVEKFSSTVEGGAGEDARVVMGGSSAEIGDAEVI